MRSGLVSKTTLGASRVKSEGSNFQNIWIKRAVLKKTHAGALKPDIANCTNQ